MTPAERLKARGWRTQADRPGVYWPPVAVPWFFTSEEGALKVERDTNNGDLEERGSIRYVPTDEQATTSPLCAALAAQGVTERDAIEALNRQVAILIDQMVNATLALPPAPIRITEVVTAAGMPEGLGHTPEYEQAIDLVRQWSATGRDALLPAARRAVAPFAFGLAREVVTLRAIGEAWKALAKAERAYAGAKDFGNDERRAAAFEACAKATAALRALGIDPVKS